MKNLVFVLVFALSIGSCTSDENDRSSDNLNLENTDLNQARIPATESGFRLLVQTLTNEILSNNVNFRSLRVFQSKDYYFIQSIAPLENASAKPCNPQTKTCRAGDENCVEETITRILEVSTKVVISVETNDDNSTTITWSYQDC